VHYTYQLYCQPTILARLNYTDRLRKLSGKTKVVCIRLETEMIYLKTRTEWRITHIKNPCAIFQPKYRGHEFNCSRQSKERNSPQYPSEEDSMLEP
jgi:hypothetical protein